MQRLPNGSLCTMNYPNVYRNLRKKVNVLCAQLKLNILKQATGRPRSLSTEDTLTLGIYWKEQGITTKKAVWKDFCKDICSYKTFVVTINRFAWVALLILIMIMRANRAFAHEIKHTDSTDVPVCLNKNAKSHKTMKRYASWGHSGKGLYYGLKFHLTADLGGRILSFSLTPANVDDRKEFMRLNGNLNGIFVADAGYVSKKLEEMFNVEGVRIAFIKPYKSMKKLITKWQYELYNTRVKIEDNFKSLKCFRGFVSSLPRSLNGYIGNYVYSLLAHVLA